eukprot:12014937-Alexandrium_andersonii.AAC.1
MSASLVGSEMCIRDSWGLLREGGCPRRARGRVQAPQPRTTAVLSIDVSYTHLTLPTICSV